jgi:VanZ family protein
MFRLVLLFAAFIVYGSLFPFTDWHTPTSALFTFLFSWPSSVERADIVQNILAYAPLGLFVVLWRKRERSLAPRLLVALAIGFLLSLAMESLQQFEPARVSSLLDLAMNVLGTLGGALLALALDPKRTSLQGMHQARAAWIRAGTLPNLGLAAIAMWFLSQTTPLVPTFDVGQLRHALAALWFELHAPEQLRGAATLVYACNLLAIGLAVRLILVPGRPLFPPFLLLIGLTFLAKIVVQTRQLSLEALLGAAAALMVMSLVRGTSTKAGSVTAMAAIAAGFAIGELAPGTGEDHPDFNWIPLVGQMAKLSGLESILEVFWPFFALALFARAITAPYRRQEVAVFGGVAVGAGVFILEWMQQSIPGRYGDITQVVLALLAWAIPWMFGYADFAVPRAPVREQTAAARRAGAAHGRE